MTATVELEHETTTFGAGEVAPLRPPALQNAGVDELVELAVADLAEVKPVYNGQTHVSNKEYTRQAVRGLLTVLADLDGDGWDQRWAAFEQVSADTVEWGTLLSDTQPTWARFAYAALARLVLIDVVRPSYLWMVGRRMPVWPEVCSSRDPEATAEFMAALKAVGGAPSTQRGIVRILGWICGRKGKKPREVNAADVRELHKILNGRYGNAKGSSTLWVVLQRLGWLDDPAPVLPTQTRRLGQMTPTQMVDHYGVASPQREVLIEYLTQRSPSMDYASLRNMSQRLVGLFWADVARHHPGLTGFALTVEQAAAWKARLATRPNGSTRTHFHGPLFTVRAFYLDMAQWATSDSYWAAWVAPSPVHRAEVGTVAKARRQVIARTQQRTYERVPLLPALVAQAENDRKQTAANLTAAQSAGHGGLVEIDGQTWQVFQPNPPARLRIRNGQVERNLSTEEAVGFWTWAMVETLRHSGLRIEEMLELTHLAFQPYTVKPGGETVPLVHIVPSKTDEERMLVAGPELVHVLSAILKRVRTDGQAVPLTQRWDPHERVIGEPMPHLFIHPWNNGLQVFATVTVHKYLNDLAARADLRVGGHPVTFTPHDFRRIFATEALSSGLPPHIVQVLLGHKSLATTMGYAAIYPQDVIRHHRTHIAMRRQTRPSEEYREPTPQEWAEFEAHFVQRRVSLGTCGRAYGTNCHHEHACLRCALLRPDPAQTDRLRDIIANLQDRIAEAEQNNWLGEVEGLKVSLAGAETKLAQMERHLTGTGVADLGMPALSAGRRQPANAVARGLG